MAARKKRAVEERDIRLLEPAMQAFVQGKIDRDFMASVLTKWLHGQPFDLGLLEPLTDKIQRSLALDGPATPQQLCKRLNAELDNTYHALFRLQKRRLVQCDRSKRPFVWSSGEAKEAK